ncbi:Oligopeptide transport system permease protein AppB [Nymphon striatum]|nr:Oligopeptide transport system permease protein AppB [Nymphon striatum]
MDDEEEAMEDDEEEAAPAADDDEEAMEDDEAMAESTAGTGGPLSLLQWQAPSQANPWLSAGTKDLLASSIVLEPLARFNPAGELVPTLATSIPTPGNGISDDGTQITWTLQDDILWADGTPLTSDDVVFTYEYCTDELTGCGSDGFVDVTSVVADDDHTITITFEDSKPYPYTTFVGYQQPILQRAQMEPCIGAAAQSCSEENFAPQGTGPYMVTDFRPEDTVSYVFNPNFRGNSAGQPFFETVTIKGGGDAEASARSVLEIGEADYAWNLQVAPEILGPMEAAGNGEVVVSFTANVEHINLNQTDNRAEGDAKSNYMDGTNPNPFFHNNPEFARALSLAINRDELVIVGYGATGIPTCNIWNVGAGTSTNNDWCLTQDIDEANNILDGLGYLDTDDDGVRELPDGTPLEFDYVTSTNAVRQSNQDLIKSYWEEIGVVANMKNEDASLFFDGTSQSDVSIWKFFSDMEMFTNGASNPDPSGYLSGWTTEQIPTLENNWGGSNMPRIASEELDAAWAELNMTAIDDPAHPELTIRVNDIISAESGGVIPLISRGNVSAFSNDIQGVGALNGWDSEYWNIHEWTRDGSTREGYNQKMFRYVIRRALFAVPTLLIISLILFVIINAAPGDPASNLPLTIPAEIREQIRESLGFNSPWYVQWYKWCQLMFWNEPQYLFESLTNVCIGDCIESKDRIISWSSRSPALDTVYQRLPQTLWVLGLSLLFGTLIAIPIGIISAYKQYSLFDNVGTFVTMIGFAMPVYFTGLLAIVIFSVKLGWFPSFYDTQHDVQFTSWSSIWIQLKQLAMPVSILTLFNASSLARFTRASALDNLNQEYVRTARSKGLTEQTVVNVHVMRNSLIPVVTCWRSRSLVCSAAPSSPRTCSASMASDSCCWSRLVVATFQPCRPSRSSWPS